VSAGSFYRELARLASSDLVATGVNPPDVDARRIPYRITERGRREFDDWLHRPSTLNSEFEAWLLFADRIAPELRDGLLERRQEEVWLRGKTLARARDDALAERRRRKDTCLNYDPLSVLLTLRIKQVAAELDFLKELRVDVTSGLRALSDARTAKATTSMSTPEGRRPGGGVHSK
jgi:DNA-binding PadR family transcriptional regulator